MKVSDVLNYMGIQYGIRGDVDYNESIKLEDLDIDWINPAPSNEDFHAAAIGCQEKLNQQLIDDEKIASYPPTMDWLLAITKQICQMCAYSENQMCDEFVNVIRIIDPDNKGG